MSARRAPARRDIPTTALVAAVVVLVAVGLVVDAVAGRGREVGPIQSEAPLLAGSTTCAALGLDSSSSVTASAIVAADAEAGDAGDAEATLQVASPGERATLVSPPLDGGVLTTSVDAVDEAGILTARWHEAPLLLARRWEVDATARVPGAVQGPCPAEPADTWVVPGITTAGGAAAELFVANPTERPASLAVTFTTPDGLVAPTRLANLAVEAGGRISVDLNEFVPEEPDLGIVVRTRAGRVVAEALQTLEAAVGGVDGRALVAATPQLGEAWTVPWVTASEQESSWLWVTNPGEEATDVRLVLHTATGPVVPPEAGVTLAPGTTQRIDLRGALAEEGTAAVTVRSAPGVPIAAAGGVLRLVDEDPARSGVALVEALPATTGAQAALSAVGASDAAHELVLVNPGESQAVVDVAEVGSSAATARELETGLLLRAGTRIDLDLSGQLPLESGFGVVIDVAEGAVVVMLRSESTGDVLDLTATAARAFPTTAVVTEQTVVRNRSLLHPMAPTTPQDSMEASDDLSPEP